MATLKEIIKEVFTTELESSNEQTSDESSNEQTSDESSNEQTSDESKEKTYTEDEIKEVVRNEIKDIFAEIKNQQLSNRTKATMTKDDLVSNDGRTVDDIMSDRFNTLVGSSRKKGDK